MMKLALPTAALLLTGTAALADLAPQDILKNWEDYYTRFGGVLTIGNTEVNGDTTRYSDIDATMNVQGAPTHYSIDYIAVQSNVDGSADIAFSPNSSFSMIMEANGERIEAQASYDLGALSLHAQGAPENIIYTFSAPVITGQQTQFQPDMDLTTTIAIEGLAGTLESTSTDGQLAQTAEVAMDRLSLKFKATQQGEQPAYVDHQSENVSLSFDMNLPEVFDTTSLQAMMFPEGAVFGMTLTTGAATTKLDQQTPSSKGRFTFAQSSFELTAAFAENALSYGLTATDATMALANTPAQPVDFTAGFSNFHWGITLPVRKADTPAPFALSFALDGFTLGPEIWAKFDPESSLSQAPASFAFSVNGTAKLFVDLFDQTALTALRGAPFELRALSLSSLSLDFEGMGLTGDGDVTFNNERIDPMSGLPEPAGVLDFSVNGALGLLDKVGRLGFMDPMVIIGAKGALGMFATPNAGPDSFTSRIEFTEGGHISVNGQQVK